MGLQVCKAHLDPFPQVARLEKRLGLHLAPRHVAGILVEVAHNASCCHARAAAGLQWARATVGHCGAISDTVVCCDAARRRQCLACRAYTKVAPLVEGEVEARKGGRKSTRL